MINLRKLIFLIGILCLILPAVAGAAPVWLSFKEQVQVAGPDVLLGDIAEVQGDDAEQVAALKQLKIGNAAAPGGKIIFTDRLFQLRFLSVAGHQPEVSWQMDSAITVETTAQQIPGRNLVAGVHDFLTQELARINEKRSYTIEPIKEPDQLTLPSGDVTYEYKLPYGVRYATPDNVTVLIYVNGQLYKKTIVRMQIHVYESVVVANKMMNTHQVISPADLRIENYDVSNLPPSYYKQVEEVAGMVTKRMIKEGTPLVDSMLDKPIIMERASMVRIASKVGSVQVYTDGQAMQPGKAGQWIRVKNTKTGKVLLGKVIDAMTVEVTAS